MRKFLRFIKKLFSRDYSKPSRDYASHGNPGTEFKATWGIVIPHTKKAQGATNHKQGTEKVTEYGYALSMFDGKNNPSINYPYETRDSGGVYGASKRLVSQGVNCILEPHLNAFNRRTDYFLLLVLRNDKLSIDMAEKIAIQFAQSFPGRKLGNGNGIREVDPDDRGGSNIVAGKRAGADIYILSEGFFIDCPSAWIDPVTFANFWKKTLV